MTRISKDAAEKVLQEVISDIVNNEQVRTVEKVIEEENLAKPSKKEHFEIAGEVVSENTDKISQIYLEGKLDEILGHFIGQCKAKNHAIDPKEIREHLCVHINKAFSAALLEESRGNDEITMHWDTGQIEFTKKSAQNALSV